MRFYLVETGSNVRNRIEYSKMLRVPHPPAFPINRLSAIKAIHREVVHMHEVP